MKNLQEKIEKRAYELYLKRGAQQGHHIEDWLQAEKEFKQTTVGNAIKSKKKKK